MSKCPIVGERVKKGVWYFIEYCSAIKHFLHKEYLYYYVRLVKCVHDSNGHVIYR